MNLPMKSSGLVSSSRSATRLPVSTMTWWPLTTMRVEAARPMIE